MSIDPLLSRLDGVKQTGPGKWMARSPCREDRTASLSIKLTDDGRILLHDFGGDSVEDVLAAVGLTFESLFPAKCGRDFDPRGAKRKAPRHSSGELLSLVVREACVCAVGAQNALAGHVLTDADLDRIERAIDTIFAVEREVRHAR